MDPDAKNWTCDDVGEWLRGAGFEKYVHYFADNMIDGEALLALTTEELFRMVKVFNDLFKLGDILKFKKVLASLQVPKRPDFLSDFNMTASSFFAMTKTDRCTSPIRTTVDRASSPHGARLSDRRHLINRFRLWTREDDQTAVEPEGAQPEAAAAVVDGTEEESALEKWPSVDDSADVIILNDQLDTSTCSTILDAPIYEEEQNLRADVLIPVKTPASIAPTSKEGSAVTSKEDSAIMPTDNHSTTPVGDGAATTPTKESPESSTKDAGTAWVGAAASVSTGEHTIKLKKEAFVTPTKVSVATAYHPVLTGKTTPGKSTAFGSPPAAPGRSSQTASPISRGALANLDGRAPLPSAHLGRFNYLFKYSASSIPLPEYGKLVRAYVSYAESPLEFSIQFDSCNDRTKKLGYHLNNHYERDPCILPLAPEMIKPGTACAAKFEGDWYRAIIMRVEGDEVLVRYVDFGNSEKLPRQALKSLKRDKFTEVPPQCIDCRLAGIPLDCPITGDQKDEFYDLVLPMEKVFLVKFEGYSTTSPFAAHMIDSVANQSLTTLVQRMLNIQPPESRTLAEPLQSTTGMDLAQAMEMDEAFFCGAGDGYSSEEEGDDD